MSQEQTSMVGDPVEVLVNVISNGSHVAATINTTTTRIDGNSAVPTVTTVATGIYKVTFSGVTPAPAEGDRLTVKVNGDISGTAWTEFGIVVKILANERGTDSVVVPTSDITAIKGKTDQLAFTVANQVDSNALTGGLSQADVRTAVGLASANLDTQLGDIPTVSEFEARTLIAAAYFDPTADTVTTDAASRTASQADVSSLATAASIAALNDIAATDIVSGGAITTSGGAVSNVTLVDTTTTNSDMRGTDNASTFDHTTDQVTTDAASRTASQADVSALATSAEIAALNDPSAADIADVVWDEAFSGHNVGGSFGKIVRQVYEGVVSKDGSVNDVSATTTTFITNLTETTDGFYHDKVIVFVSGTLAGQARHIETYVGSTKSITVSEAFTSAPADADEFLILATHEHSITEIQAGLATQTSVDTIDSNVDAIKVKTDELTFTVPNKVDASATIEGGDATAANQTTIIGLLTGASIVVSQSSLKAGDAVEVRQGMDYNDLDGTAISWTGETDDQWPDLTGATVTFYAVQGATAISKTCTVTSPTGTQSFRLEFTASELSSDDAPLGNYRYYIIAVLSSGRKSALVEDGTFRVKQPY